MSNSLGPGLRDKFDQSSGLMNVKPETRQYNVQEHTVIIDTRDCIGAQSFADAQTYAASIGVRGPASGTISTVSSTGSSPTVITASNTTDLAVGDSVIITKVYGASSINGIHIITATTATTFSIDAANSDTYKGGGIWNRLPDSGFPEKTDKDSYIFSNQIQARLTKDIKFLRSISLYHIVIPRDIIPLTSYIGDFLDVSVSSLGYDTIGGALTFDPVYTNYIPQERKYLDSRLLGFYSSDLELFRTYIGGTFTIPDQITPSPLNLWNTTAAGQPEPYPYQTVPSLQSADFAITGEPSTFYVMSSGYGIYDLVDWTDASDSDNTEFMRTLLLLLICPKQSYRDVDYIDLILNSSTISQATAGTIAFGFGDYQRYVPGPGLGMNYQPGTNTTTYPILNTYTTVLTVAGTGYTTATGVGTTSGTGSGMTVDIVASAGNVTSVTINSVGDGLYVTGDILTISGGGANAQFILYLAGPVASGTYNPVAFPDFRGNVWGPYNRPGDRFQKVGLRSTIQDLFMNGDLQNIAGAPTIQPDVIPADIPNHPSFGLNFASIRPVNLGNITSVTNLNILNAMRIVPNGYGAQSFYVNNAGSIVGTGISTAGGIGPSEGSGAWVNTDTYGAAGTFNDPIAKGPSNANLSADLVGPGDTIATIINNASYYDLGANNGQFINGISKYIGFAVNEIPDTDLIIRIREALREERAQSTNTINSDALLDCPIRLNLGSTSGTLQYVESLQSLIANASTYWEDRYMNPKAELSKLTIELYSYDNTKIPIEKMLQLRQSSEFLQLFTRVLAQFNDVNANFNSNVFLNFLFNPLNPRLIGRTKRYMQIIFKIGTYLGTAPGLEPDAGYKKGDFS